MSAIKEWALTEDQCVVCGREFLPFNSEGAMNTPGDESLCSMRCKSEYDHVMNALADMQEATYPPQESSA